MSKIQYILRTLPLVAMLLWGVLLSAQELNCQVTINSQQVEGSNRQVFESLKNAIEEYLNQTKWTNMTFAQTEKIDCTMLIVVNSVNTDNLFSCSMTLQSRRPVFNTQYTTTILNLQDGHFNFVYQEFDRIDYQDQSFTTNLADMLAFYAYLIIGEDCDSFAKLGGQPYFQICEHIVQMCQSASITESEMSGWKAFDSNRNRYALCSNIMDEAFKGYREYIYDYHRLGLDKMSENVNLGRAKIAENVDVLRTAYRSRPATYLVNTFLDAKSDELVELFKKGTPDEKKKVYDVLTAIDPTRQNTYDAIKN